MVINQQKGGNIKESTVVEMLRDAVMVGMSKRKKDSDSEIHDLILAIIR